MINAGYFDTLPISGNEKLTLKFYSYTYSKENNHPVAFIHRTFDVLKIKNITENNDYSRKYSLFFASPELLKNETIRISKAYSSVRISDVIGRIMTEDYDTEESEPRGLGFSTDDFRSNATTGHVSSPFLKQENVELHVQKVDEDDSVELFIENTLYEEPWITVPYAKPFEIIRNLSSRATRKNAGRFSKDSSNFVFFENKRGFQFVSLDTLLEQKDNAECISNGGPVTFRYGTAVQNKDLERDTYVSTIETLKIEDCYDLLSNIRNGLYASKLQTYDFVTGQVVETIHDYSKFFSDNEHVDTSRTSGNTGAHIPLKDDDYKVTKYNSKRLLLPLSSGRYMDPISSEMTGRFSGAIEVGPEQYLQNRIVNLLKFTNFKITVQIPADSRHKVGDIINLDLKYWDYKNIDNEGAGIKNKDHKYYSGNYLITNIKHVLSKTEYKMIIELAKDSLKSKIGDE